MFDTENINVIEEEDLTKISLAIFESLLIKREYKRESVVDYKEDMIKSVSDLLKKMLVQNTGMSKESKLNIIILLDKLNTQREHLEIIKSKISISDIQQASKRLSKKSQSAFELK
jgi:hypothetical protein